MKFTLSWLKKWLETEASLNEIVAKLTDIGLEVEEVTDQAALYKGLIVAQVRNIRRHPEADRLSLCDVHTNASDAPLQVVCGANNLHENLKVAFAPVGACVPCDGSILKKGKIRGVESFGMICSSDELSLGKDESGGIMHLDDSAEIGTPIASHLGLDNPIIELGITPNRADCLGVRGIARDLQAAGLGILKPLHYTQNKGTEANPITTRFEFPAGQAPCRRFATRLIKGVKNGDSPQCILNRLQSIGLKPVSFLVDLTNFLTFDLGRPLHVFDADKIQGSLTLRLSAKGEKFAALDDQTYTLDDGMLVICDDSGIISLAGVMGGASTACDENTTNVLLESAWFEPISVARTGRALNILSDARFRFERGIDPDSVMLGIHAATYLIELFAGDNKPSISEVDLCEVPLDKPAQLTLRYDRIEKILGMDIPQIKVQSILKNLGFQDIQCSGSTLSCIAPSWRIDMHFEEDLIEEVARLYGYDHLPVVPLPQSSVLPQQVLTKRQTQDSNLRRTLSTRGLQESITFSFMAAKDAAQFNADIAPELVVENPISADLDTMRPSIVGNLLLAAKQNAARGNKSIALFELGPQFASHLPDLQQSVVTALRTGMTSPKHWNQSDRKADVFDIKADALAALEAYGIAEGKAQIIQGGPDWYHPGQCATIQLGPKKILGYFGTLHPTLLKHYGYKGTAVAMEILLDQLPAAKTKKATTRPAFKTSIYQKIERDFAFLLPKDVPAGDLTKLIQKTDPERITEVTLFDVYTGENIDADKKSIALSVTIQPQSHTLNDDEIEAISNKIVSSLAQNIGAQLRQ